MSRAWCGARLAACVVLATSLAAAGQDPRADDCLEPMPSGTIATIGEERIPTEQVEALVRPALAEIEADRTEDRHALILRAVGDHLLRREAARRGIALEALLDVEVHARVPDPAEIEIAQRIAASPAADPAAARAAAIAVLRREKTLEIGSRFVDSLARAAAVEWRIDIRAARPGLAPEDPVVLVDGEGVPFERLAEEWEELDHQIALRAHFERRSRLDLLVNSRLLERAAREAGVGTREFLAARVEAKLVPVTDEEIAEFIRANESRIDGTPDAAQVRDYLTQVRDYLTQLRRRDLELALAEELRERAGVQVFLAEPLPPVHEIDTEGRPGLGPPGAPLVLVQFTDLQCARCREVCGIVEDLPELHPGTVRVVLLHKPLPSLHPLAMGAAIAVEAAAVQGRCFDYVRELFRRQETLAPADFEDAAATLGLDLERFRADRDGPECRARVAADLAAAERLGLHSTPVLYLNGRRLDDTSVEGILVAVQRELRRLGGR